MYYTKAAQSSPQERFWNRKPQALAIRHRKPLCSVIVQSQSSLFALSLLLRVERLALEASEHLEWVLVTVPDNGGVGHLQSPS